MTAVADQLAREIERDGSVSFARFMELALYAPGSGYYESQKEIGRRGDFYTSVSVGPLFGELLAFRFAQWAGEGAWQIVEAGAHGGALAADILGWLERWRPDLLARLEYCVVEPSPRRREWQRQALASFQSKIKWAAQLSDLGASPAARIIFSNELLDAMPVHRLVWDAAGRRWRESRVAMVRRDFVWQLTAWKGPVPLLDPALSEILPDGFVWEFSPPAVAWWSRAAQRVAGGCGKLLTFDYGFTLEERLQPQRASGTLRAYARHQARADVLANPGGCDLTAHVDFSALAEAGRAAGLATEQLQEQGKYLTGILADTVAHPELFPAWTPERTRQFQTLTHPDHLGRAFRVLVQSCGFTP